MLLDWDQKKGSISWRSDGEYFVVNFIDSEAECRKFQVFNRESVLYSTVENDINVLDSPITWKFSKSLIASSIYRFKKHEIVFFERNGLVHGGFPLPFAFNTMKVKEILWNLDSSILENIQYVLCLDSLSLQEKDLYMHLSRFPKQEDEVAFKLQKVSQTNIKNI